MMVAEVTETYRWSIIYVKPYYISVHLLVHYISVNTLISLPGEWHQVYAAVGGNGEACDTDMADNKDGEGIVNKADGRPAAAVAAAAVDMEGIVDEVQEV